MQLTLCEGKPFFNWIWGLDLELFLDPLDKERNELKCIQTYRQRSISSEFINLDNYLVFSRDFFSVESYESDY